MSTSASQWSPLRENGEGAMLCFFYEGHFEGNLKLIRSYGHMGIMLNYFCVLNYFTGKMI